MWVNLGCNHRKSYGGDWSNSRNFEQNFIDYFQWRANKCGEHGLIE